MKGWREFHREVAGTTVVELALLLPAMVMIIFGIWAVAWVFYNGAEARHAVEIGSRIYISNPSASLDDLRTAVASNLKDVPIASLGLQSSSQTVGVATVQHITWTYQTTATIPFLPNIPLNFGGVIDVPLATP